MSLDLIDTADGWQITLTPPTGNMRGSWALINPRGHVQSYGGGYSRHDAALQDATAAYRREAPLWAETHASIAAREAQQAARMAAPVTDADSPWLAQGKRAATTTYPEF